MDKRLQGFEETLSMRSSNRRLFLWTAAGGLAASSAGAARLPHRTETVYRFSTPECDGQVSVRFFDKCTTDGFWFDERLSNRAFCLSGKGEEGKNCLPRFSGSVAVAVYHLRSRGQSEKLAKLREHVRTIDQDISVNPRPPFERMLDIQGGVVSDIQAFGYTQDDAPPAPALSPWCLLRQDLYFDGQSAPFLIVHWKHTLNAISVLDLIPGTRTQLIGG